MTEPHTVSDPGYALPKVLRAVSTAMWERLAGDLVECARRGDTFTDLQSHILYLLTVVEFQAGMLHGHPNPERFFLPALHEELDRAGVPPSAVHPSLGYGEPSAVHHTPKP